MSEELALLTDLDHTTILDANKSFEMAIRGESFSHMSEEELLQVDQIYYNLKKEAEWRGFLVREYDNEETGDKVARFLCPDDNPDDVFTRRAKSRSLGMVAAFMSMAGATSADFDLMPSGMGRRRSYSTSRVRHDPNRPKTKEDLDKIEKARLKRERKEARRKKSEQKTKSIHDNDGCYKGGPKKQRNMDCYGRGIK